MIYILLLQYLSRHLLCDLLHDRKIFIIRSEFVDDLLFAEGTLMEDHKPFVLAILESYWSHQSVAVTCTVAWKNIINMLATKAVWTMVSSRAIRMKCDLCSTAFAGEFFISHYKTHAVDSK